MIQSRLLVASFLIINYYYFAGRLELMLSTLCAGGGLVPRCVYRSDSSWKTLSSCRSGA